MPPSVPEQEETQVAGQALAVSAEVLYLTNLLLLPGLAFIALMIVYVRQIKRAPPLAACHLRQTVSASLWAALILIVVNIMIIALGGYASSWTWVIVILYFTLCHAALVLLGTMGLAKAMAGKLYRFPLVGRPCET
ncbi:MAG: hypothetical protein GC149_15475 [Gammaproteobacteria bacterium]|nr:hypothetical protein [Gammaproteobacteria bacterium]